MMGKLLPLILALAGLGAGLGAGVALRPGDVGTADAHAGTAAEDRVTAGADEAVAPPAADDHAAGPGPDVGGDGEAGAESGHDAADDGRPDYVKLSNQFIVPVVEDGRVASMVILSLSLEVAQGATEAIFAMEPKLRDGLLQVLFDHANAGGFRGSFTDGANLIVLRRALLEAARKAAGDDVRDVLIADIARQDG